MASILAGNPAGILDEIQADIHADILLSIATRVAAIG
jgi:hypothetical protein